MSDGAKLAFTAVTEQAPHTVCNHGNRPGDTAIGLATVSSAEARLSEAGGGNKTRKYRHILRAVQKVNMLFLVLFVCYFAWTISAHHGGHGGGSGRANGNGSSHNVTLQVNKTSDFSGNHEIPFYSSSDNSGRKGRLHHPNLIFPTHQRQPKRRRKKERHKKRLKNGVKHRLLKSYNNLDDYLNISDKPLKRKRKKSCSDCKIRKRKGRNRNEARRVSALTLRKILERVADETLSGARSGEGTISDLYENASNREIQTKKSRVGWSYEQHWVNIAANDDLYGDRDFYQTVDHSIDGNPSPWSAWSECTTKCGPGQKERMRSCGSACKEVESMVCLNSACEDEEQRSAESEKAMEEFYKWESDNFVPPLKIPDPEYLDSTVDSCSNWVECSRDFAEDFIRNSSLPGCPCDYPLRQVKSKELWDINLNRSITWEDASSHGELVYKPGAQSCIRSKLAPGAVTLAVQQCCYDNALTLVTRGRSAGTPNLISPEISEELHYKVDLLPWIICKGDWTRYTQVLPPNNVIQCTENPSDDVIRQQKLDVKNY